MSAAPPAGSKARSRRRFFPMKRLPHSPPFRARALPAVFAAVAWAASAAAEPPPGPARKTDDARPRAADSSEPARGADTVARMVGETSFAYRDRAVSLLERELAAADVRGAAIRRGASGLSGAARIETDEAVRRINEARAELAKAISRARAADEARWTGSRREAGERLVALAAALEAAGATAIEGGARLRPASAAAAPP